MAERFIRDLIFAAVIFVVVAVLVYSNLELVQPVTEYVNYVVTTDISFQPVLERMKAWDKLPQWQSWLKELTEVTSGW
ncbi:MAG TPA: hypothetical protein PLM25_07810 [Limnochordia bacterium]|nr:hypothetical protein [Limnochordia bacterium]